MNKYFFERIWVPILSTKILHLLVNFFEIRKLINNFVRNGKQIEMRSDLKETDQLESVLCLYSSIGG